MRSRSLQRAFALALAVMVGAGSATTIAQTGRSTTPKPPVKTLPAPNKAADEFKQNIQKYVDLRTKIESGLPKIANATDPKKLEERGAALAGALQAARKDVKQGEIFTPTVAAEFRRILAADAAKRTPKEKADIMEEVPVKEPVVNAVYPTDSPQGPTALASFPPRLLKTLPQLPDVVDYRFMGKTLIIRDVMANTIVDYLPAVAPAPARGGRGGRP
jgi:hypothetical protein